MSGQLEFTRISIHQVSADEARILFQAKRNGEWIDAVRVRLECQRVRPGPEEAFGAPAAIDLAIALPKPLRAASVRALT